MQTDGRQCREAKYDNARESTALQESTHRKVLLPAAPATALVRETCRLGFNTWLRLVDAGTPVRPRRSRIPRQ
jgi:hypothetical protein